MNTEQPFYLTLAKETMELFARSPSDYFDLSRRYNIPMDATDDDTDHAYMRLDAEIEATPSEEIPKWFLDEYREFKHVLGQQVESAQKDMDDPREFFTLRAKMKHPNWYEVRRAARRFLAKIYINTDFKDF